MTKSAIAAQTLLDQAASLSWTVAVRGQILTITKSIIPNCNESFSLADMEYPHILGLAKSTRAGSEWGTDGSGVGGLTAMKSGSFVMNKSGISKRFLTALSRLIS